MIFLLTNERDITTDYIVRELRRRGIPYFRLNSERLGESRVILRPASSTSWTLQLGKRTLETANIQAGYYRRPGAPTARSNVTDPAHRNYVRSEWSLVQQSITSAIGNRWLNSPWSIARAEDKPSQLIAAMALGFDVPETLISNDHAALRDFVSAAPTILKPLREALLSGDGEERVMFTTEISCIPDDAAEAIEAAPVIAQRLVRKALDIRVTVVGESVFSASISSQGHDETRIDWRRGSNPDLPHAVHRLPEQLERRCVELVHRLDLRFGAIDLVLDEAGAYWFLEINPNGQWAWIENRTKLPIAKAIVDELVRIATK